MKNNSRIVEEIDKYIIAYPLDTSTDKEVCKVLKSLREVAVVEDIDLECFRKVIEEETLKIVVGLLEQKKSVDGWFIMSPKEYKDFIKKVKK